ncbi:MAG TPA: hypothetical protein PK659_08275 [Methanothrix sp.]|nr:hypothetical protein [Methanothrix sp.]HOL44230.1 hypothetical protein [Methanothrix sp.]
MALIMPPGPEMLMEADAGTYYEGELLKEGSSGNRVAKTTAASDLALFVVVSTRLDPKTGAVEPFAAGQKMRVFKLGSKAVVHVRSVAGATYTPGSTIYLASEDAGAETPVPAGLVTDTPEAATGSRPIGHYPRNFGAVTTTEMGELIPCYLDVEVGADLEGAT